MLSVDASGYGGRNDVQQEDLQRELMSLLNGAATLAGLRRPEWQRQPAGDGELAILPPTESEPVVVDDYVRELYLALARRNWNALPGRHLRLRLAMHFGSAKAADLGYSGQGVVEVSRLVDSRPPRLVLERSDADLVLIVSGVIFETSVAGGHTTLAPEQFRKVEVRHKELLRDGYLFVPGRDVHAMDLGEVAVRETPKPAEPQSQPRVKTSLKDVRIQTAVFGFANGAAADE